MALTGDNRIDSLRTIQSMCDIREDDSEELQAFKRKIIRYADMGVGAWHNTPHSLPSIFNMPIPGDKVK